MELVFADVSRFDVIHFHCDYLHLPLLERNPCANVTTLHGMLHPSDVEPLLGEYPDAPLVSISNNQRTPIPWANWQATVHHGLPRDLHTFRAQRGSYLAFLGRISPEKRLDRAIAIARAAGMPLRVAAKIYPEDRAYYHETIEPLLRDAGEAVELIGEVGGAAKDDFLGNAHALLFPIDWPEPFGLVMIEAMACGTPVIAYRNGSVPEVIEDGVTGFIVRDEAEAVRAVERVAALSRHACRLAFERRFDATAMVDNYVEVYRQVVQRAHRPVTAMRILSGGSSPVARVAHYSAGRMAQRG
jgi:glycosyltransferase involved in cell wall biosynthesis